MAESTFTPGETSGGLGASLNPATAGLYYATMAKLNFSVQKAQAEGKQALANLNSAYEFNRGNALRQEPIRFQQLRNQANSQGLAESGVAAQNAQRAATGFAEKAQALSQQRAQAAQKVRTGIQNAEREGTLGQQEDIARAGKEQAEYIAANTVAPVPSVTPSNAAKPAPVATVVASKPQPSSPSGQARKAAVGKIKKGWGVG